MNFTIVPLRCGDGQRNKAIRLRALAADPDAFGSVLAEAQKLSDGIWQQRLARTDMATFVATTADHIDVGLIVGAPYDNEVGLFSMWVAPEVRKGGVGGALVDAVIEWARAAGHHQLILDVADNNRAAVALYASRGFVPNGKIGMLPPPREHITEHQRVLVLGTPS